jgi:hypothetical protein
MSSTDHDGGELPGAVVAQALAIVSEARALVEPSGTLSRHAWARDDAGRPLVQGLDLASQWCAATALALGAARLRGSRVDVPCDVVETLDGLAMLERVGPERPTPHSFVRRIITYSDRREPSGTLSAFDDAVSLLERASDEVATREGRDG